MSLTPELIRVGLPNFLDPLVVVVQFPVPFATDPRQ